MRGEIERNAEALVTTPKPNEQHLTTTRPNEKLLRS